jgi:3-methyl-2-oxobutanoate hydroxymethyltransferase
VTLNTQNTSRRVPRLYPSSLQKLSANGEKIVAITAYDYFSTVVAESAEVDVILVGDSVGTVVAGHTNTLSVSVEQMIYHCEIVSRLSQRALIVGDMPFMSYESSPEEGVRNAGALIKEGGVGAVKLEGGVRQVDVIERIVRANIPVMGHIGLTPQAVNRMGGFKVQGKPGAKGASSREAIIEDAKAVEAAGAFAVVIEGVPEDLGREITEMLSIPTIGIGAGRFTDGQILVMHDLLGLNGNHLPKFVKRYIDGLTLCSEAASEYAKEVRLEKFPFEENVY